MESFFNKFGKSKGQDSDGVETSCELQEPSTAQPTPEDKGIVLELRDFVRRIPPELLKPGGAEAEYELRFDMDEVASHILSGNAKISLSEIVRRCPEIFKEPYADYSMVEIFFPWQKLAARAEGFKRHLAKIAYRSRNASPRKSSGEVPWFSKSSGDSGKGLPLPQPEEKPVRHARKPRHASQGKTAANGSTSPASGAGLNAPGKSSSSMDMDVATIIADAERERNMSQQLVQSLAAQRDRLVSENADLLDEIDELRRNGQSVGGEGNGEVGNEDSVATLRSQLNDAISEKLKIQKVLEETVERVSELERELSASQEVIGILESERDRITLELDRMRKSNAAVR